MKKLLISALILCLILSGCGQNSAENTDTKTPAADAAVTTMAPALQETETSAVPETECAV